MNRRLLKLFLPLLLHGMITPMFSQQSTYLGINIGANWQKFRPEHKLEMIIFPWKLMGFPLGASLSQTTGKHFESAFSLDYYYYYMPYEDKFGSIGLGMGIDRIYSFHLTEYYNVPVINEKFSFSLSLGAGLNMVPFGGVAFRSSEFVYDNQGSPDTVIIYDSVRVLRGKFFTLQPGIRFSARTSNGMRFSIETIYSFGFAKNFSGGVGYSGTITPPAYTDVSSDGKLISLLLKIEYPISRIWQKPKNE